MLSGPLQRVPPLRTPDTLAAHNLPVQLTSFVGRGVEMHEVRQILADNRLVTLIGAGGVGKTRMTVEIAAQVAGEFGDGVWYVDLASIADPDVVPITMARALGLPDQPGRSMMHTLARFIGDRQMLVVLDNCGHQLDAVPSLSLADEAIELFIDRARLARTDFNITDDHAAAVTEIYWRLDGMPLAIELAAARVRTLSLTEIVDGLHDRFRFLTGGARTAVRHQQTLRASVDWSHALLTEPELVLFRQAGRVQERLRSRRCTGGRRRGRGERYQVLDQLTLLIDKSLDVAEDSRHGTRYRLLHTMRQYALEKLGESGEADTVRARHRDYYTLMAALLDAPARTGHQQHLEQAETDFDNLRAAFAWSVECSDIELASALASSLQPLWLGRGHLREGLAWFEHVLTEQNAHQTEVAPAVRARTLADKAVLDASVGATDNMDQAQQALAIARELDDPALLARALTACGCVAGGNPELARQYFAEASSLARALGDGWRLSQILGWQALGAAIQGDPIAARAAAEEGTRLRRCDRRPVRFASVPLMPRYGAVHPRAIWSAHSHSSAR